MHDILDNDKLPPYRNRVKYVAAFFLAASFFLMLIMLFLNVKINPFNGFGNTTTSGTIILFLFFFSIVLSLFLSIWSLFVSTNTKDRIVDAVLIISIFLIFMFLS